MSTSARAPRRSLLTALLAVGSLLATLGAIELVLRLASGSPLGLPDPGGEIRMVGERYPGSHHPHFGYLPTPGVSTQNVWRTEITITDDAIRSNGAPPPPGRPIVAVGDSFTFGDEVSDPATWPAQLEARLGRPVLNGGVFGYGLDQIVLRAEALLERFSPDTLVVSFIPNDVRRCEYAYRFAWKPYFAIEDGALALKNVPVPEPHQGPPGEPWWRRSLRWSFLADFVGRRLDPEGWLLPDSVRAHKQGVAVARLLVDRLVERTRAEDVELLLMLQWHPVWKRELAAPVLAQARQHGIPVLDLERDLQRAIEREGDVYRFFRRHEKPGRPVEAGHMTAYGNAWVAAQVSEALARDDAP